MLGIPLFATVLALVCCARAAYRLARLYLLPFRMRHDCGQCVLRTSRVEYDRSLLRNTAARAGRSRGRAQGDVLERRAYVRPCSERNPQ